MNKKEISSLLQNNYQAFINQLHRLNDADFCYAPDGKWSAAQQVDHIVRSVAPVNMAMGLPKFILWWRFGKANRPSKTYEALVAKYNQKLQQGGRATGRFVPPVITPAQKQPLINKLSALVQQLCRKTERQAEDALDTYILPHPLLGFLTLREMLYFTAYHVRHHQALVQKGLQNKGEPTCDER